MATILLIEDEKLLREDIGEVLVLEEFDVLEAANGRIGIQIAITQRPDLILCDISMPEADGYEVLTALRDHRDTVRIPFIFLTARVDTEFVRRAEGMGVDEYMTKPFSNSELMVTIRSFLRQRELFASFHADTLDSLKSQVAVLAAHELRAHSVSSEIIAGLIARQLDEVPAGRLLALVNAGQQHLMYLTKQLSNMVRIEQGLVNREKIQNLGMIVGLWSLLNSAISQARQLAQCFQPELIRLEWFEDKLFVQCDSRALRQALADPIAQALNASLLKYPVVIALEVTGQQVSVRISWQNAERTQSDIPELLSGNQPEAALRLSDQIIQEHGGMLQISSDQQIEIVLPLVTLNLRYG